MPTLTGQRVDKYDMLEEVGCGGMAVVYRSRDRVLDREVAVKVLHPHLADREESRQRLRREALTVAKLRHDNIVEIFDYSGPDADESYIVTEFIHGPTLAAWMAQDFAPRPALAALIVHHLCQALAHAHEHGVVHRDLKPENVMIREVDGCLKLMDFGIAQILDQQKLTLTGQLLGSPAYMAPELINGRNIDARTDLFSIGILLYQLATGTLPFSGRNPHEVLNRIADAEYPRPSSVCPLVDDDLEEIIARSLAREPDDRYQSARALASDLQGYLDAVGIPTGEAELRTYFTTPVEYVRQLDERVCRALVVAAERAVSGGNTARALALLGRIVELDPEHAEAHALLDVVRRRGQRMRQLLVVGALTATGGLAAAAVVMMQREHEQSLTPPPVLAAVQKPRAEAAVAVKTREPPTTSTPAAQAIRGPTPPIADASPVAPGPSPPSKPASAKPPRTRDRDRPNRRQPDPETTRCRLRVDKIPVAQRGDYSLSAGTRMIPVPRSGAVELDVPPAGVRVSLVDGPRYDGQKVVYPGDCTAEQPVVLLAKPKAIDVEFVDYPDGFVVQCHRGCVGEHTPQRFPRLRVDPRRDRLDVELTLRARGFKARTERKSLSPGHNEWRVDLEVAEAD
ncbi:MAG: serine/threonine protein kinase [Myxococcales bacterium FL481]|nr:MAG: serine/threonine protein kinase [Myxococcales bacterium FL481]